MSISQQIEAVYQRALLLRQYATESPIQQDLLEKALQELYFVLEELQTSEEELHQQNQLLIATRQAVEAERQRYQTLFDLAPNGYLVTDLQGKIYQANHYAASHLFGTAKAYLVQKPLLFFIHEGDRRWFQSQLATPTPQKSWEVSLKSRNGKPILVSISFVRIKDSLQQEDRLLWSLHDITLRKQTERELQTAHDQLELRVAERTAELLQSNMSLQQEVDERQQAEQKIRDQAALLNIASDAIFVQDLDQRIVFWNQGAERLYGWKAADILGKHTSVLFQSDAHTQLVHGFTQTLEQRSWHAELDQVSRTGNPLIVKSRWDLVRNEAGQPKSILVVNTDITEKKQLESQFYRAQRIESLGTLASGIAHDLNNILTPILTLAQIQLTRKAERDNHTQQNWQLIHKSAQRGADLVQQITQFAQGAEENRSPLDLGKLLLSLTEIIRQTFPKSVTLAIDLPSQPLGLVAADHTQLFQAVMNLCVNARDAMPNGGTLTLAIAQQHINTDKTQHHPEVNPGSFLTVSVSDTGSGIPPALIEHIFEPFFTTKPPGKGTGLGLSTVFNIVKHHSGFIEVDSEIDKGTQFQVYLPVLKVIDTLPIKNQFCPNMISEGS